MVLHDTILMKGKPTDREITSTERGKQCMKKVNFGTHLDESERETKLIWSSNLPFFYLLLYYTKLRRRSNVRI